MKAALLRIHPDDNVLVALVALPAGATVQADDQTYILPEALPAKHKLATTDLAPGDPVYMYGVLVGRATRPISRGGWVNTHNLSHDASAYQVRDITPRPWSPPDITPWAGRTFMGYHRADGRVGTANYWLVIPLVFCENRNLDVLREALVHDLGYARRHTWQRQTRDLIALYQAGHSVETILSTELTPDPAGDTSTRVFPHVDGIKFLTHDGGCGGTRQDAQALCGLLAGYITHPNVAGATVLSLGCQHAQVTMLQEEIHRRDPHFQKPLYILDQQQTGTGTALIAAALRQTFAGLMIANTCRRAPAPLSQLCIGLECGGSDGFSGISANPAIGHTSDLLVALGGSVILSEFPELCGVEQELCDRCQTPETAHRFATLMTAYNARATADGSGFDMNPSPGNIRDGLITDAIKSAGAAKKGGTSPVTDVLDYPEPVRRPGLNLLCTPGNDVESTTAEVASGANIVLFTTGLGTPTGNPIVPVIKIATHTALARRMPDIIDLDTGPIIEGDETLEAAGARILDYVISVASGETQVAAVRHGQDDFIPWKRGISL